MGTKDDSLWEGSTCAICGLNEVKDGKFITEHDVLCPEFNKEIFPVIIEPEDYSERFLGPEKYRPTLEAIYAGLGIPDEVWKGEAL